MELGDDSLVEGPVAEPPPEPIADVGDVRPVSQAQQRPPVEQGRGDVGQVCGGATAGDLALERGVDRLVRAART
ncbi:hypothetical protein, partial [Mycobacterium tuberculosis]|uniref:hypothetical protein n=1 Tax=Mycobacterium tuberculosis TaxID=1773 RepID=UPI001AEA75FF|nr:hypothetical protein [Mycobacterium tuberculosis]